ncbi:hypothetical protein [Actinotalea sp.]|uniref:ABC transporter permease subunit n=1 Tax=Actinotalea sp. TaxID=1872145 RepID=UPI0035657A27
MLLIVGVLVVAYSFVMGKTVFGRHIYAIGGNLHAAILSGVDTRKVNFWVFVNIGALAGVAGVVTTSRAGAPSPRRGRTTSSTPSPPASSVGRPSPAVSAASPARWSARSSWASSTWACPS